MRDPETDAQLAAVLQVVTSTLRGSVEAGYLYGSAVMGGLRPASDLDLLVLIGPHTSAVQRRQLVEGLAPISDRRVRPPRWRPIELTLVVEADIVPWRYPPRMDFQWGEWLRASFEEGQVPAPRDNPDLAVLLSMARARATTLIGRPTFEALPLIPNEDLVRAMTDGIEGLLADLGHDTANVLLTLARIWNTIEADAFSPKDAAADWALARLPDGAGRALKRARDAYLGFARDAWTDLEDGVGADAQLLVGEINAATDAHRAPPVSLATIGPHVEQVPWRRDLRHPHHHVVR